MVVSLGPGKFYGTSLPRPRIYTDVKFNDHRVDPPTPVTDPLISWAQEAHWSMGGFSFKRLRLQGKIEGNVQRLRSQRDKAQAQALAQSPSPTILPRSNTDSSPSHSPPPAPVVSKRRRYMHLIHEEDEEEDEVEVPATANRKRRLVKKLGDDFDRVALDNDQSDALLFKTRSKRIVHGREPLLKKTLVEEPLKSNPNGKSPRVRTSPRFAKRASN